jgi:hypothetical protein
VLEYRVEMIDSAAAGYEPQQQSKTVEGIVAKFASDGFALHSLTQQNKWRSSRSSCARPRPPCPRRRSWVGQPAQPRQTAPVPYGARRSLARLVQMTIDWVPGLVSVSCTCPAKPRTPIARIVHSGPHATSVAPNDRAVCSEGLQRAPDGSSVNAPSNAEVVRNRGCLSKRSGKSNAGADADHVPTEYGWTRFVASPGLGFRSQIATYASSRMTMNTMIVIPPVPPMRIATETAIANVSGMNSTNWVSRPDSRVRM